MLLIVSCYMPVKQSLYSYMPMVQHLQLHVIDTASTITCKWHPLYSYMSLAQSIVTCHRHHRPVACHWHYLYNYMSLGPSLQLHVIRTISTATNCCHCLYLYIPLIVSSYMPLVQSLQLHTIGYLSLSLQLHAIDTVSTFTYHLHRL